MRRRNPLNIVKDIRIRLIQCGCKQKDLAEEMNCSPVYLTRVLNRLKQCKNGKLYSHDKIFEALHRLEQKKLRSA